MALSESIQLLFTQFDILVESFGTEMINFYFDQIQSPTDISIYGIYTRSWTIHFPSSPFFILPTLPWYTRSLHDGFISLSSLIEVASAFSPRPQQLIHNLMRDKKITDKNCESIYFSRPQRSASHHSSSFPATEGSLKWGRRWDFIEAGQLFFWRWCYLINKRSPSCVKC